MRKLVVLILLSALSGAGCTPDPSHVQWDSLWRVMNSTDRTVTIALPESSPTIAPGQAVDIYTRREFANSPYFEMMMVLWRRPAGEEIAIEVLSTDGEVLKRWVFQGNGEDWKFFWQDSWAHYFNHDKRRKKRDEWIFEILPEDLQTSPAP